MHYNIDTYDNINTPDDIDTHNNSDTHQDTDTSHDVDTRHDVDIYTPRNRSIYGVATISRLLKISGLFCRI